MTKRKIEIKMVHDVVCSWCPIGYSNITAALTALSDKIKAEITFLPFELNPNMAAEGETIEAHLKRRNGWTTEQLLRYRTGLIETAKSAGLTYNFSKRTHYRNTAKAHTLIHWAEKFGKQEAVNRALIQGYFTDGINVDSTDDLLEIARSVGLDPVSTKEALGSSKISHELQLKKDRVRGMNVTSVPSFLIDGVEFVPGSNFVDYFVQYFTEYLTRAATNGQLDIAS